MDIIMVPFHDYRKWETEGYRTRDAHLFQHFQKDPCIRKIFVINRPISLAEFLVKKNRREKVKGTMVYYNFHFRITKIRENAWCLDIYLPDFWSVIAERKNWWYHAFCKPQVKKIISEAVQTLEISEPVILLQNPMAVGVLSAIPDGIFTFDAIDNWLYHPQMSSCRERVEINYRYIRNHADCIFTVSRSLQDFFSGSRQTEWIPNGVDRDFFRPAFRKYQKGRIVIGYAGKIQNRLDFELVEECLDRHPEWEFCFLGPVYAQKREIRNLKKKYSNIRFPGDVCYDQLPLAMKKFDVAIIPHYIDQFTESMNPLKLYEYLASGKPVVTTEISGIKIGSEYVYHADTAEKFVKVLEMCVRRVREGKFDAQRIADSLPDEYLWKYQTEQMTKVFQELYDKKKRDREK